MVETRSAFCGLKHQKEKRNMDHFAGLDVSVRETSVCIVDDTGRIVREVKGSERTGNSAASADEPRVPVQADWIGSRTTVAMVIQCAHRSGLAGERHAHRLANAAGTSIQNEQLNSVQNENEKNESSSAK
jgi:hypothetical protein